jgi:hypothetical protein
MVESQSCCSEMQSVILGLRGSFVIIGWTLKKFEHPFRRTVQTRLQAFHGQVELSLRFFDTAFQGFYELTAG